MDISGTHLIRFVSDQASARDFYAEVLGIEPRLDVPGMTELELPGGAVLGLMPRLGIERILERKLVPGQDSELYLVVEQLESCWERAVRIGAEVLQPPAPRDWGHRVGYLLDPEGSLLALAAVSPAQ